MTPSGVVLRLAVLLEAGLPPDAAWRHLARSDAVAARVAEAPADETVGILHAAARDGSAHWALVGAMWRVATEAGAPLAPSLARLGDVLAAAEEAEREVRIALAGPRATSRIVLALPPLGLALGLLLGVDTLAVLATTPPGWVCLAAGVALLLAARRWMARLVVRASAGEPAPGLAAELVAVAIAGGGSPDAALERVAAALAEAGLPADDAPAAAIDFARGAGAPVAVLLRAEARDARRAASARARERIAALGTRLLVPLGACVLPAFVARGVLPMLIAMLRSTLAGF